MNADLGPPTRPMNVDTISAGGSSVFAMHTAKVDMEPSEEELVDYSSKFPEAMEESKSRPEAASYQEDDIPRVYCTEGTPRHISRASSAGDLSGNDKRRQPETIHEQDEVKLASHTATANATPQIWSRSSSPNSLSSYCLNSQPVDDAHSVISEFSRQPSGIISPSDLPDSPGQTMPPSPKDRRRNPAPMYSGGGDQPKQFTSPPHPGHLPTQQMNKFVDYHHGGYHHVQSVHQSSAQLPSQSNNHFTPIPISEAKLDSGSSGSIQPLTVRPHPEPRQMRSYADSKMVGDPYMQEDSLHNYRTEDTPANLSAATSFSDLSSICPKSDYHGPVPRPRRRKPLTPLPDVSQLPPLDSPHSPPEMFTSMSQSEMLLPMQMSSGNVQQQQQQMQQVQSQQQQLQQQQQQQLPHRTNGEQGNFDDQKSESSYSWKPRTLPRKVRQSSSAVDANFANGNANNSMPDLNKGAGTEDDNQDSEDSNSEDDELLRQVINRGRPARSNNNNSNSGAGVPQGAKVGAKTTSKNTQNNTNNSNNKNSNNNDDHEDGDSDSESDNQDIINELIKAGRPASRSQMAIRKGESSNDGRDRIGLQSVNTDKATKQDKFKAARSMENLNAPLSRTVKKGSTNFRVREQPLRGAEGAIPKQTNIARAQSMKSNKSLGYDQLHDRRQTKTPEPNEMAVTRFDAPAMSHMFHNKPVSKVSPMRSQTNQHVRGDQGPSTSFPLKKTGASGSSSQVPQIDADDHPCAKQVVLLSPVKSSVRQSSKTCLKRTTEVGSGEVSESSSAEEFPPRPPKPPQFRGPPRTSNELPGHAEQRIGSSPEPTANTSIPDILTSTISRTHEIAAASPGGSAVHDATDAVLAPPPPPARDSEPNNNNNNNNSNVNNINVDDKSQVPPEPPEDCGDITVLSFKFTDSNRSYTRRFLKTNQFHSVVNYLQHKGFPPEKYKIVVSSGVFLLKKEVTENCFGKTLAELKMVPKKTLTVKPR